jgi:hypothetical protein
MYQSAIVGRGMPAKCKLHNHIADKILRLLAEVTDRGLIGVLSVRWGLPRLGAIR